MRQVIRDKNGKISSKRIAGLACFIVGLSMAIVSGFDFYNVDTTIIMTVFGAGTGTLGIGAFETKK